MFWQQTEKLTNKFEPFYDFGYEQTMYELKTSSMGDKEAELD